MQKHQALSRIARPTLRLNAAGRALVLLAAALLAGGCEAATGDAEPIAEQSELGVSAGAVAAARASKDPSKIAEVMRALASQRFLGVDGAVAFMKQLFDGLDVSIVAAVRAKYISRYAEDPEITIRSGSLLRPLARMSYDQEFAMFSALNRAQAQADAALLAGMLDRAERGQLSASDRKHYFSMLPRMGLWDAPVRSAAKGKDAMERLLLQATWSARGGGAIDDALNQLERKFPDPELGASTDRSKAVAVVASSHGAQWQEFMGWAVEMRAKGYHLQVFSANGRPIAFQRDSMAVSKVTAPLGFGCPPVLDPASKVGALAAELLANTVSAARFNPDHFGAVYLAGGLGFNEDVAYAAPNGSGGSTLTANPNIATLMAGAISQRMPIVAICHGPTLLAAVSIKTAQGNEALNKGIATASLPPFEGYVGITGRKDRQFIYDVNTHGVLAAAGGQTNVLADIANMGRVVQSKKAGIEIITGPGPQAATALASPTMAAMARRWR
jgi:putative intracellular protease/amidase